jgi:hypothetical protein
MAPIRRFTIRMLDTRFTSEWWDERAAKRAFEHHNAAVRAAVPSDHLIEWHPGDGWSPLCNALEVPVPREAFPHANTTADFQARNFAPEGADAD